MSDTDNGRPLSEEKNEERTPETQNLSDTASVNGAKPYLSFRGPESSRAFTNTPSGAWDSSIRGEETVEDLRVKLSLKPQNELIPITVTGTLFPSALLSSGWWEKKSIEIRRPTIWRNGLQKWLFNGFDAWGPSWDFTWDMDQWEKSRMRKYFIAQLANGDEANSLPVLIPHAKAQQVQEQLLKWGGFEAKVTCVLGHRKHFGDRFDADLTEYGGLLDYCLWLDEDDKTHQVTSAGTTDFYSGYLWKCLAPKRLIVDDKLSLEDVYFVWEHANYADKDAMAYHLQALEAKKNYIETKHDEDLVLIQKSSSLIPGDPHWTAQEVYAMFVRNPD